MGTSQENSNETLPETETSIQEEQNEDAMESSGNEEVDNKDENTEKSLE